jgi:hypothetical protein
MGDFFGFTTGDEYDLNVKTTAKRAIIAAYLCGSTEIFIDSDQRLARASTFEITSQLHE